MAGQKKKRFTTEVISSRTRPRVVDNQLDVVFVEYPERPGVYEGRIKEGKDKGKVWGVIHQLGMDFECKGCKCVHCLTWSTYHAIRARMLEYLRPAYNLLCINGTHITIGLPGKRYAGRVMFLAQITTEFAYEDGTPMNLPND